MQVFILQCFTRIVKNLKKRENTENLCLIIRGSQVQALLGPRIENQALTMFFVSAFSFSVNKSENKVKTESA